MINLDYKKNVNKMSEGSHELFNSMLFLKGILSETNVK